MTRFRDAVAALYEPKTHRLDAPPLGTGAVRPLVREYVATKAEIVSAMQSGRVDAAVDGMRHLKHTEWTLRLGDVGSIGTPRNEPMVRTRSKFPGIVTPEVNSDLYVSSPTPSGAESAEECECFLEAMRKSVLARLEVEPISGLRILRPQPRSPDPPPGRGLP